MENKYFGLECTSVVDYDIFKCLSLDYAVNWLGTPAIEQHWRIAEQNFWYWLGKTIQPSTANALSHIKICFLFKGIALQPISTWGPNDIV